MSDKCVYQELGPIWETLLPKVISKHWPTYRELTDICATSSQNNERTNENPLSCTIFIRARRVIDPRIRVNASSAYERVPFELEDGNLP
jgi:hypothetical protein